MNEMFRFAEEKAETGKGAEEDEEDIGHKNKEARIPIRKVVAH
jgi:hypothetical protein